MQISSKLGRIGIVILCLVLAVFTTVELAHSHPAESAAAAAHCQICSVAHVAIDTHPAWLTSFVLQVLGTVSGGEPNPGARPVIVTAFIRPPPVSL